MKRVATILVMIKMATASFGQVNHMHDGENETIYEKAIKELVKDFKDDGPIYIADDSRISNFFWDRQVDGREIVFISNVNEKEELKKNENLIRVYEIEYPTIKGDQLQIKINHVVIFEIDLFRLMGEGLGIKTYSSIINNAWTYVTFLFDSQNKEFKIEKIETKTVGG